MEDVKAMRAMAPGLPDWSLVALKGYGDLAIALTCLDGVAADRRDAIGLLLGKHLRPLFEAIGPAVAMKSVEHGEAELPAIFDIKRQGYLAACGSAFGLRRSLRRAAAGSASPFLFDRLGARERFIAGGRKATALPDAPNIYLGYEALFARLGLPWREPARAPAHGRLLRIFPGSRVAAKALPRAVVDRILRQASGAGLEAELMLLEGESPLLECAELPVRVVPRRFDAMIDAVRGGDFVISADSLPAHVAEYAGRPVFVFSPVANRFWLPRSAFVADNWALTDQEAGAGRFEAFLARASQAPSWSGAARTASSS